MVKEQKNTEGRIICLEAKINKIKVNLCNIYAPNIVVFHNVNRMVGENIGGYTIMAWDFNQVLDAVLDKTTISKNMPKDRLAIKLMMKDLGLIDIWRLVNPREREYTVCFFS